jgi:hypothetical protein
MAYLGDTRQSEAEKHEVQRSGISPLMLDHCAACPEKFRYMRGRIFQFEDSMHREYFWLCPHCAEFLSLEQAPNGQVHVIPRGEKPDLRRVS